MGNENYNTFCKKKMTDPLLFYPVTTFKQINNDRPQKQKEIKEVKTSILQTTGS